MIYEEVKNAEKRVIENGSDWIDKENISFIEQTSENDTEYDYIVIEMDKNDNLITNRDMKIMENMGHELNHIRHKEDKTKIVFQVSEDIRK
jgi:hypothetical protein